ncbi:histidine phosphatase family protein [Azospirillum sp. YIM B02556]|uniref:Histidine phosphatase family protein n=1 Tax=Azospirillum endophyticum TaxID=2800326 RepID=A0ABS1F9W1_9PROT|nr:histidine phosphatase family protein [Azospirillum endophyticum]MBK1840218.1 histidine phosphatase family protein [Azospirillum endophyticum]
MLNAVIFCRHGETESNLGGWLAGSRDVSLTDRGRAQAREAAVALLAESRAVPVVYSSPQRRALETAGILAEALEAPVVPVAGLEERRWGDLEGGAIPADLLREEVPNGESLSGFRSRVTAALDGLPAPADGRPPLIVAHAGTWPVLCRWLGLQSALLWPPNASPVFMARQAGLPGDGEPAIPMDRPSSLL